ncbi:MAG: hypothetical protein QG656_1622 [Candidatus Hydrogenedentes bacterium]|nr:hypothetical protein [Candidatus Hydrogenedentota bacterium]
MLNLDVWQDRMVFLALGAGVLVTLFVVLAYLEGWRTRKDEAESDTETEGKNVLIWFVSFVPWTVVLITVGAGIWGFLYAVDKILHPPNW